MEGTVEWQNLAKAITELYVHTHLPKMHSPRGIKRGEFSPHFAPSKQIRDKQGWPSNRSLFPKILNELLEFEPDKSLADVNDIYAYDVSGYRNEFRRFLPWFLEEIAVGRDFGSYTQILFAKFLEAKFSEWHRDDQSRIENYVFALWRVYLLDSETDPDPGAALDCFALILRDLRPLLEIWLNYCREFSEPALSHFYSFLEEGWSLDVENKKYEYYPLDRDGEVLSRLRISRTDVKIWLLRKETREVFESICLEAQNNACLEWAFAIVQRLQANRETSR